MNDVTKLVDAHLALCAITDSNDRAAQIAQTSEKVLGWDVLHFDGDLIDCLVMFIPGYEKLNVPGHTVD